MKKLIFKISIILVLFIGCEKADEYSEIPYIEFKNFTFDVEKDDGFDNQIGYLTFDFIDGNGDIGFTENSDTSVHIEIHDIFVYGYTKINGNFIPADTTNFILPYFSEGVYRKHIKGEMKLKLYFINRVNDTLRYDFQIMDRMNNSSNLESTPELIVPEWN